MSVERDNVLSVFECNPHLHVNRDVPVKLRIPLSVGEWSILRTHMCKVINEILPLTQKDGRDELWDYAESVKHLSLPEQIIRIYDFLVYFTDVNKIDIPRWGEGRAKIESIIQKFLPPNLGISMVKRTRREVKRPQGGSGASAPLGDGMVVDFGGGKAGTAWRRYGKWFIF